MGKTLKEQFSDWTPAKVREHNARVLAERLAKEQNYGTPENRREAPRAEPQPVVRDEPVAAQKGEAIYSGRVAIRITSFRARLCDPDNLVPKYFIDGLRYSGLISDDREADITLHVEQKKVASYAAERTEIVITPQ